MSAVRRLLILEKGKGEAAYLGLSMASGPAFIFIQPFYLCFYSFFEGLATLLWTRNIK